jgi:hypothetical protein
LAGLIAVASAANSAMAQSASSSSDGSAKPRRMPPVPNPLDLETEASATDFMQDVTQLLNDIHNEYLGLKKELKSDYNIQYSMQVSIFPQWGTPKGGPGTAELVYAPNITWNPFTNTAIGSGSFNATVQQNQF